MSKYTGYYDESIYIYIYIYIYIAPSYVIYIYILHMMEQIHSGRSSNVVRDIKSTMRKAGHVASNGAKRNIHRVPVTKSEGKKAYTTPWRRLEENTKIYLK